MTQKLDARLSPFAPGALSVFRVIVGLLFLCHATQKLFGWPTGPQVPAGTWPFFYAGHKIELDNLKHILEYRHAEGLPMTIGGPL